MNKKLKIGLVLFSIFIVGLLLGKAMEYYSNDYCKEIELKQTACLSGCEFSDLPQQRYNTCSLFCEQQYKILDEKNSCTILHKLLR